MIFVIAYCTHVGRIHVAKHGNRLVKHFNCVQRINLTIQETFITSLRSNKRYRIRHKTQAIFDIWRAYVHVRLRPVRLRRGDIGAS